MGAFYKFPLQNPSLLFTFMIVFVCLTFIISHAESVNKKYELHNFMDESELSYYFNDNHGKDTIPDYEIIHLKGRKQKRDLSDDKSNNHHIHEISFKAFERHIKLRLKPNEALISPNIKIWVKNEQGDNEDVFKNHSINRNCYLLHKDKENVAAFSDCLGDGFSGIILAPNDTLEVQPLTNRLKNILSDKYSESSGNFESAHIITKVLAPKLPMKDAISWKLKKSRIKREIIDNDMKILKTATNISEKMNSDDEYVYLDNRKRASTRQSRLVIEVGIFFDEAAYKIFSPYFGHQDRKISEMLLAYMNGVQALYQHPSLGTQIDISIVHMEIMRRQPASLPTFNGERDQLLDSFCDYQKRINPPDDHDANHWDMGLYISGLDFYTYENGRNTGTTMGLATVRGVCSSTYSCVIAEFGTTNSFGKPYPSAGFTSVYILAHEMGHSLGMAHDSTGNSCSSDGYIMSPSRGTQGETEWSSCSAQVMRELPSWADCLRDRPTSTPAEYNAWKYRGFPGQSWSAKRQCELLLIDTDATTSQTSSIGDICQNLQCRSPHRSGYYFAGPALEGTDCGSGRWCEGGICITKKQLPKPSNVVNGGWSPWRKEKCSSGCLNKAKGFQPRRRTCDNPKPVNTNEGCDGASYDVILCDDIRLCGRGKRRSALNYADVKCKGFSRIVSDLDPRGVGLQAPHEMHRLWMGCTIFCRRRDAGTFYTPRLELNDLGMDPYFPDGTWCHSDNTQNYYCQQHHCLPEGFQFNKIDIWLISEDVPISGNANPNLMVKPTGKLLDYLSLDEDGKPKLTQLNYDNNRMDFHPNEKWIDDDDFRELPNSIDSAVG